MSLKSHAFRCVQINCVLGGLDWAEPMMLFILHVTCSCISHAYVISFQYTCYIWTVLRLFWLSLSLPLFYVCVSLCLWHLKASLLCPRTLFVLRHPLPLILLHHIFCSVMRMRERPSWRTFLNETFILNSKSSWQTLLTLTNPMSFIVGVGSHCVTSRPHVHPWWSRSFTSTCMDLIIQYLSSSLAFEVRA